MIGPSISDIFELYRQDYIVFKNQSAKTEENHMICGRALVRHFGDIPAGDLTFEMIRDWKNYLSKNRTEATVRNYIIKLRVTLAYARKRVFEVIDPETIPVPQRADIVPEYITPEEVQALIDSWCGCRQSRVKVIRSQAMISLLYGSGIRVSELINLDQAHIINDSFTVVGKGGKARLCFVDERTSDLLRAYLRLRRDNHQALFVTEDKHVRIKPETVQCSVRSAAKRAGINRHITPHTLRHSFATDFIRHNGNVRHLQELLGHKSLETTAHYAHVVNEDLRKSFEAHHTT